jgi:hypothetical protein
MRPIVIAALIATLTACGDDDPRRPADAAPDPTDGAAATCEDFATEHEELLNAPTDATVIVKTPTHPPVGPDGLP